MSGSQVKCKGRLEWRYREAKICLMSVGANQGLSCQWHQAGFSMPKAFIPSCKAGRKGKYNYLGGQMQQNPWFLFSVLKVEIMSGKTFCVGLCLHEGLMRVREAAPSMSLWWEPGKIIINFERPQKWVRFSVWRKNQKRLVHPLNFKMVCAIIFQ